MIAISGGVLVSLDGGYPGRTASEVEFRYTAGAVGKVMAMVAAAVQPGSGDAEIYRCVFAGCADVERVLRGATAVAHARRRFTDMLDGRTLPDWQTMHRHR